MNRRGFLKALGFAPIAAVAAVHGADEAISEDVVKPELPADLRLLGEQIYGARQDMLNLFNEAKTGEVDPATGAPLYDARKVNPSVICRLESNLRDLEQEYQSRRLQALAGAGV